MNVGDRMSWLWSATPNGSVLKVQCVVIGFTPKRVRIRTFVSATGELVERLVSPDDLNPFDRSRYKFGNFKLQGISDNKHTEYDDWHNQPEITWDDLTTKPE